MADNPPNGERLAILETEVKALKNVPQTLARIEQKLDRQHSFIGGIALTVSAGWGIAIALWDKIFK